MAGSRRKSKNALGSSYTSGGFTGGTTRRASSPVQNAGRSTATRRSTPTRTAPRPRPAPAPRRAPARASAPRNVAPRGGQVSYNQNYSRGGSVGGGGFGGSIGGGGGAPTAPVAPPKPKVTQENFLAGDESLKIQQAALMKALQDYTTSNTSDVSKYNLDYGKAVDNIGWRRPVADDPATPQNEAMAGAWNFQDENKASGRAFQNQQNDFAGRGMLQSSLYAEALDGLMRSLNDQLGGIDTAKTNFESDKARELSTYTNENTNAKNLARNDAISRYAALYGNL